MGELVLLDTLDGEDLNGELSFFSRVLSFPLLPPIRRRCLAAGDTPALLRGDPLGDLVGEV